MLIADIKECWNSIPKKLKEKILAKWRRLTTCRKILYVSFLSILLLIILFSGNIYLVHKDNMPNLTEEEARGISTKYLNYARKGKDSKLKNLYINFDTCKSCQIDFEKLITYKNKAVTSVTIDFLSQNNSLKLKLECEKENYEPTLRLLKSKSMIFKYYNIKIKEVMP